jgi:cytochrome c-type biogenesis protein CcmE
MSPLALAITLSLIGCSKDGPTEYLRVDDLIARGPATLEGQSLKVRGWVEAGSLRQTVIDHKVVQSFVVLYGCDTFQVFYTGSLPDPLRDQSEVVVTGRIVEAAKSELAAKMKAAVADTHVLESTELSAKCPTNYDSARTNKNLKYE